MKKTCEQNIQIKVNFNKQKKNSNLFNKYLKIKIKIN